MTPEYLNELADIADPDRLWSLGHYAQTELPPEKRRQRDAGVAIRRYAEHVRRMQSLLDTGYSLLLTPLSPNGADIRTVPTPSHVRGEPGRKHHVLESRRQVTDSASPQAVTTEVPIPLYQCRKQVLALKIKTVAKTDGGKYLITPCDDSFPPFEVASAYFDKHWPEAGGYYVVYEDGYESYIPAKDFEKSYTRF